ncbi:Phthiocerol synthesis polyketide synthase type I PpsA [Nymphon striatum]|nr:Phthiocerol synthesis polyketide synthase type I PpsA [Nymphon striatum]
MTKKQIRNELIVLFMAGHETTANVLAWTWYLISQSPEVEKKLHDELDEVLHGRAPEFADVEKLKYTRAILDETMRLYPPVPILSREALEEDTIRGKKVPPGSIMLIVPWLIQRHKKYWDKPDHFIPERFMPDAPKPTKFTYIPFSAGPRVCLGKNFGIIESVLSIAILAQQFRLSLDEDKEVEHECRLTLRPKGRLPMKIHSLSEAKKKIAVVGMACRFPGEASSPEAYWEVLKNGKDVVTEVYFHQVDEFDAAFFGISPREAAQMDPQQRLLLELTWEALEDGKQIPQSLAGSQCAVYVGIASTDYAHRRMDDLSSLDPYSMTGNTASIASNRISYIYDLHGPSASMLSPRGRCRAFDATGDGYVRSEGSAVLFLKPLEDAEADGDPIHAVIVDTAINSDGRTNGITLPSTEGQAGLLETIYTRAGVKPDDLSYLEAHGTGTAVGDPLEAGALAKVLGRPRKKALPIGSAKTNLGHLETASGMAGLLKVILSLKNKAIPPSLHFETPNPNIDFKADKLSVVTSLTPLKGKKKPLIMGVNSFGFGGANAHVIVEEYKEPKSVKKENVDAGIEQSTSHPPLLLTAKSENALKAMAGQYRDLQKFDHGLAVNAETVEDVIECLHAYSQGELHTGATAGSKVELRGEESLNHAGAVKLALVFSGNGSQWQGMGCELLDKEPLFLETVLEINKLINEFDDISLIDEFKASEEESRLHLTEVAQPLLFALQVGLIRVLESHGLKADAVIGHSVGEVAAAWAAGALNLAQATEVIYRRSHAQGKTSGMGRMAAAAISELDANKLIKDLSLEKDVSIAGINSPKSVTLSGSLVLFRGY